MPEKPDLSRNTIDMELLGYRPGELVCAPGLGNLLDLTELFKLPNETSRMLLGVAMEQALRPRPPEAHLNFIDAFYRTVEKFITTVDFGTLFGRLSDIQDILSRMYAALPHDEARAAVRELFEGAPEGFDVNAFLETIPTDFSGLHEMEFYDEDWKRFSRPPQNEPFLDRFKFDLILPDLSAPEFRRPGAPVVGGDLPAAGSDTLKETTSNG